MKTRKPMATQTRVAHCPRRAARHRALPIGVAALLLLLLATPPLEAQGGRGRGGRGGAAGPPDTTGAGGAPSLRALVTRARQESDLRVAVQRFNADRQQILARYDVPLSPVRIERERALYNGWLTRLQELDVRTLNEAGRTEHASFRARVQAQLDTLALLERQVAEMSPLLPFVRPLQQLQEQRRDRLDVNGRKAAQTLEDARKQVLRLTTEIAGASRPDGPAAFRTITPAIATRVVDYLKEGLRQPLDSWYTYHYGFDPLFTWWARVPYKELLEAMDAYVAAIQREWRLTTGPVT